MQRMKRKSEATSRGHFLLPNQFDLDMLRDTIEVGRDLDESEAGGLAVKLWRMTEKKQ
jgi:hypothetical protein